MKVWLVGGGTAGHVVPLLALAAELSDSSVTIVTDRTSAGKLRVANPPQRVLTVTTGKFRRYRGRTWLQRFVDVQTVLLNLRDVLLIGVGVMQAFWYLVRQRPDAVFLNGGAIGVPVSLACRLFRVPYLVHESDTVLGMANRFAAKGASQFLFGLDPGEALKSRLQVPVDVVGIQLRSEFFHSETQQEARQALQLPNNDPVVLITGGSLGGRTLVEIVLAGLESLVKQAYVIHVTGNLNAPAATKRHKQLDTEMQDRYRVLPYVEEGMARLMRAADVVISRAGATTLAELAFLGRPSIIVPNPRLAGGHQNQNAAYFAAHGAAIVLTEEELRQDSTRLTDAVATLIGNDTQRQSLSKAAEALAIKDAGQRIVAHIQRVGTGQKRG